MLATARAKAVFLIALCAQTVAAGIPHLASFPAPFCLDRHNSARLALDVNDKRTFHSQASETLKKEALPRLWGQTNLNVMPPHFRLQERFGPVFMPSKHDSLCHFLKSIWEIRDYLIFSNKFYHEHEELAEAIWNAIEDYKSTDEYRQMKIEFEK
jgi:hypothetical protein